MLLGCSSIVRIISFSKVFSNNFSTMNNLNIIDKYHFRGRRKYNISNLSVDEKSAGSEAKSCKIEDVNEIIDSINQSVPISSQQKSVSPSNKNSKGKVPCRQVVNSDNNKLVKNVKEKNMLKLKHEIKTEDIDIENCEKPLEDSESAEKVKWVPKDWEEMLTNIREMRKDQTAPVDDMGCHKTMDQDASPKDRRYQALVSLMLSSQTKDQITYATMLKLRDHGLTVENILKTDENELAQLIKSVGFWRTKAKHIKRTTQILKDEYGGDIPDSVDKMLLLPGVGPKMAHLCMTTAWGKVHGIGVDTHVHRISNRLQWVKKPTNNPEQTRIALESWLPPALWFEVNHLMVGFGQQICLPRNPKCRDCINNKICPFGKKELRSVKKKT